MTRITLPILSIIIATSQASKVYLKGTPRQSLKSRSLQDANDDIANHTYLFEVESYARGDAEPENNTYSEAAEPTTNVNVTHIQDMIVNQAQKYKDAAESKAWEFYSSSPSEWTESQWNFVMLSILGMLLCSCCCLLTTCAYCCVYRGSNDDDETFTKHAGYIRRMRHNRLKRYRNRYRNERQYEEDTDTDTIESQPTFDSGGSISVASSFEMVAKNDKKESLLKKSGKSKRKSKETKGSYESPKNRVAPQSPDSILSTFEMNNGGNVKTPQKSNGRNKKEVLL